MTFSQWITDSDWQTVKDEIMQKSGRDVEQALSKNRCDIEDFKALISPAAGAYLEQIAHKSQQLTRQRFGATVSFYIPLYLSNLCSNSCTYCGFSMENRIKRRTLSMQDVREEFLAIKQKGYDSILLVTGEHTRKVGINYFRQVLPLAKEHFSYVALEVQPLSAEEYCELKLLGLNAVYVYQETYHRHTYKRHHLRGNKTDFDFRLETAERLCQSEIDKVGLGALLGLHDWRIDSFATASHLRYLENRYWKTRYSVSFPRLRPCEGMNMEINEISDRELVQLICAYRIFSPSVELSLSTRESSAFRDNVVPLGITNISAESRTQPGGYAKTAKELEQFSVSDQRKTKEVANAMQKNGLQPVFKDWEYIYRA
ncbi:2-iminoacetate synthase ThiH [Vibrio sp. SCSIO 43137]|uniref:2-iminoacetate synthase ThiH n=1 Tax=Vibrio sp. SCSIO 43137 TaxID=3021011 RepID=UPI0023083321|nr:2-iminoacetate synthase ThiH [Vibrio sp. SCSIO 43137]WCE32127.1 2-iminoacetate synthase ThiH [Vibrio sp. SCSIO 43137]